VKAKYGDNSRQPWSNLEETQDESRLSYLDRLDRVTGDALNDLLQRGQRATSKAEPDKDEDFEEADDVLSHARGIQTLRNARQSCSRWKERENHVVTYLRSQMTAYHIHVHPDSRTWEALSKDLISGPSKLPRGNVRIAWDTALRLLKQKEKMEDLLLRREYPESYYWSNSNVDPAYSEDP